MPNVNPESPSPPPVSGKAEDPHHLEQFGSNQGNIESPVIHSENKPENPLNQTGILPHFPDQDVSGQVNDRTAESSTNPEILDEDLRDVVQTQKKTREDVIKEISISSTAFIGPVCQPKVSIEQELSEFYKELEQIDNQDTADGVTEGDKGLIPPYPPKSNLLPGKEIKEREQKNYYRPYPAPGSYEWSQTDHRNSSRSRPPSHNKDVTWDCSVSDKGQWQRPMPRFLQDPSQFHYRGPRQSFPCPPPGNPMCPLYSEPQENYYSYDNSRGSWEGTKQPRGYDMRFTSSNRPGAFEQYEGNLSDWQHYKEQNYQEGGRYCSSYEGQNYQEGDRYWSNNRRSLVLILMRGLPGSGKSTLAKEILSSSPGGLILSTDDYFFQENGYFFDPTLLGDAHGWNQKRAREAMLDCRSPIIIDNTNVQAWEMKPYVAMALESGYRVEFTEPGTSWKCDPVELEMRNKHRVPRETITKMLDRFELPMSVDIVMNSTEPPHKSKERVSRSYKQKTFDYM